MKLLKIIARVITCFRKYSWITQQKWTIWVFNFYWEGNFKKCPWLFTPKR